MVLLCVYKHASHLDYNVCQCKLYQSFSCNNICLVLSKLFAKQEAASTYGLTPETLDGSIVQIKGLQIIISKIRFRDNLGARNKVS